MAKKNSGLLEEANEVIACIDRAENGMSFEEATKWFAENWSLMFLKYSEDAAMILKKFFLKFYERHKDASELVFQPFLAYSIAEEEHTNVKSIMAWFCGTVNWASIWRDMLNENGLQTRKSIEDIDHCALIERPLWKEINDRRYLAGKRSLQHHYEHSKFGASHSEKMAGLDCLFDSDQYHFIKDGYLAEDVMKIEFAFAKYDEMAREIFDMACKKGNVLRGTFTGIGIGLYKKDGYIYVTLRYSTQCAPKKD